VPVSAFQLLILFGVFCIVAGCILALAASRRHESVALGALLMIIGLVLEIVTATMLLSVPPM
jgi:uncharacterized membrane protein HdeD (DUF308 family)